MFGKGHDACHVPNKELINADYLEAHTCMGSESKEYSNE